MIADDTPQQQVDLFGQPVEQFASALSRYGTWPVTVWPINLQDATTKALKLLIGDDGAGRADVGIGSRDGRKMGATYKTSLGSSDNNVSIFNPQVAANILNLWAVAGGNCYDPFAGGGTRAIMAAKHGLVYRGVEIRPEEVRLVNQRIAQAGLLPAQAEVCIGDARNPHMIPDGWADFMITCPPYYDLEQYDGGPDDLSMLPTYARFIEELDAVVAQAWRILRPGAVAVWVVGLHRDKHGELLAMHHDLARIHKAHRFRFKEEVVLHQLNTGSIQRVGSFDKGDRRLVRTHEYAVVFIR